MTRAMDRVGPCAGSPGLSRVLLRGRGFRALCGEAAADRDRVGDGGIAGTPRPAPVRLSLGGRAAISRSANLDQLGSVPRRSPRFRGTVADRLLRYDRRRLGVDLELLRGLARLRGVPRSGILRGLLRQRVQGPCSQMSSTVCKVARPAHRSTPRVRVARCPDCLGSRLDSGGGDLDLVYYRVDFHFERGQPGHARQRFDGA